MPRNKLRVELALYARPRFPDEPHWAILIAPKHVKGHDSTITKHHVKNTFLVTSEQQLTQPWRHGHLTIHDIEQEPYLLVRVVVAKAIVKRDNVVKILADVPVYQKDDPDHAKAEEFNCKTWVREALQELNSQGAVVRMGDWAELEREALGYVKKETDQGRWRGAQKDKPEVYRMDLLDYGAPVK